ncbi:MAG: type II toxin-antitoxin system YafQ family toxin [Cardiobacteriaceae bacterium]|nr:type II toxin-antitoxin system YafQ family toxin [Cardiobacteriaceae bacterium]
MSRDRRIRLAKSFKRDAKKHHLNLLSSEWAEVLHCLTKGLPLPERYRDHALTGDFKGLRDCHIKPDLVLIYRLDDDMPELHHLNSHSEIFR